ncbi:hypothetical protein [Holdemania filiformis]|uniref:hypothetical protein n=1 Tax=Holdemania filiformis TaxID=61171 RepID=UPI002675ACB4|nr:hypothetical protein [Holdemania filiformis]
MPRTQHRELKCSKEAEGQKMRYGNDTNSEEEKANDFLNKMIIAEKVAKGSIILGVILTVVSFLLFQPLLFLIALAFDIGGIPFYFIYRGIRRQWTAQLAKEERRAEIEAEQGRDL